MNHTRIFLSSYITLKRIKLDSPGWSGFTPFLSPTITFTKCPKVGTIVFGYSMHFRGWSTKNPKNLLGKKNFTPEYSLKDKVVVVKK